MLDWVLNAPLFCLSNKVRTEAAIWRFFAQCSFIIGRGFLLDRLLFICCKTKLKKKSFLKKYVLFTKYTSFAEKNVFIWKKCFIFKNFFTEKNFYREKYKWKCKKYVSHLRNIFLYRKCSCYKQNIFLIS